MLIDSNIIIYSAQLEYESLRRFIAEKNVPVVSAVCIVEVLVYQQLAEQDRDVFIAATALVDNRTLVTRNVQDFD